jgi:ABC-2 type transport system permease protein
MPEASQGRASSSTDASQGRASSSTDASQGRASSSTDPGATLAAADVAPAPGLLVGAWRIAAGFMRRDFLDAASYRFAFVLRLFGFAIGLSTVYFAARFVNLARSPLLGPYGQDYFAFSLVGLIFVDFQWVATGAFARRVREAQNQGTLEAILATPAPLPLVLGAAPLYDFAAAALRATLYLVVGALVFGVRLGHANLPATLLAGALAFTAFVSLGLCAGAFALLVRRSDPISLLLGGVSMLASGVWYPVHALPGWLRHLGDLLPMTHALEAMRRALLAGAPVSDLGRPLGALALLCLVTAPLGVGLFAVALRRARVDGSLTHY